MTRLHGSLPTLEDAISGRLPRLASGGWSVLSGRDRSRRVSPKAFSRSVPACPSLLVECYLLVNAFPASQGLGWRHPVRFHRVTPDPPSLEIPASGCSPSLYTWHQVWVVCVINLKRQLSSDAVINPNVVANPVHTPQVALEVQRRLNKLRVIAIEKYSQLHTIE